jgi:hypothetical protein
LPDGRVLVWGDLFEDRGQAVTWAAYQAELRPGSRILVGASLPVGAVADLAGEVVPVAKTGAAELRTGLPLLRTLLRQGRLVHGGDTTMGAQVTGCRVSPREGGLAIPNRAQRTDLVRCVAWCVQSVLSGAEEQAKPRPVVF